MQQMESSLPLVFFFFPDGFYLFFLLLAMGKISAEAH